MFQISIYQPTALLTSSAHPSSSSTNFGSNICSVFRCLWLLIPGLLIGGSISVHAQVFGDEEFRLVAAEALDLTYDCEFEASARLLERLKDDYQAHPAPYFLLATNRWWQSLVTTSPHFHDYIQQHLETALKKNESLKSDQAHQLEYVFFQYMSYAFLTRLYTLRREWFSAANTGRKALPYLRECLSFAEESPEFYFSAGIYHYYAATYPADHGYVRPFMIFFPDGDEALGIQEMEQAANTPNFAQMEALFYLGDIFLGKPERVREGLAIKQRVYESHPANPWFQMEYGNGLLKLGQYAKAAEVFTDLVNTFEQIPGHAVQHIDSRKSPYTTLCMERVYYFRGMAWLKQSKPESALADFQACVNLLGITARAGDWVAANAYFQLGQTYDRLGKRGEAIEAYETALDQEEADEIKSLAKACLKTPCLE